MNTEIQPQEAQKKELPQLIKQSATYKIIIPKEVEEKIRYLCRKFPTLEWSGVLFTQYTGSFENDDLVIICKDIFPMDLGTATYTEFSMSPEVAGYMAENIELFECDLQLIHSHNQMSCFFSGTDTNTLREEGNDRNCFVSLIVNNAGTYCAAITRKVKTKHEISIKKLGKSYEFFGAGTISLNEELSPEVTKVVDKEIIEYFMLDIEKEEVTNPLSYLDTRFDEIQERKRTEKIVTKSTYPASYQVKQPTLFDTISNDETFRDYLNRKDKDSIVKTEGEDTLDTMASWIPDINIIQNITAHMILCSLTTKTEGIDLKQWIVKHMVKVYDNIFFSPEEFDMWAEAFVEFSVNHYTGPNIPKEAFDEMDLFQSKIAEAIVDCLGEYTPNYYLNKYIEILNRYIYE